MWELGSAENLEPYRKEWEGFKFYNTGVGMGVSAENLYHRCGGQPNIGKSVCECVTERYVYVCERKLQVENIHYF